LKSATDVSGFEGLDFVLAESYISSLEGLKNKNILLEANLNQPADVIKRAL
jgi:hypothetical protein